jgi:hypothetical protein
MKILPVAKSASAIGGFRARHVGNQVTQGEVDVLEVEPQAGPSELATVGRGSPTRERHPRVMTPRRRPFETLLKK